MTEGRIQVGMSDDYLETALFEDSQGRPIHREAVYIGDADNVDAKLKVTNAIPSSSSYGAVVRPIISMDFMLSVASGAIPGTVGVNKFGRNSDITAGTTETIWDGSSAYSFPATAIITSISQTTDQVALRGGQIEVEGLDANWDRIVQSPTLDASNTTTPVLLATPLLRCYRARVLTDVEATSDIRVHNVGETQDYAIILAGNGQTLMAVYTVPSGKTAYVVDYYAGMNPAANKDPTSMQVDLYAKDNGENHPLQVKHTVGLDADASSHFRHPFTPYLKLTEKTDVFIQGSTVGKAADISAGFDIILVDN